MYSAKYGNIVREYNNYEYYLPRTRTRTHTCRDLSDADKDGKLSKDEFVIAMFLVDKAKQGCSLPSVLPVSLQPSSTSSNISAGSYSPGGSFEEKRRAHFEQGRLELERRQKQLQEQLNKEKVRCDRRIWQCVCVQCVHHLLGRERKKAT